MKKRYLFLMTLFVQLIMGGVAFAADPPQAEYEAALAAIPSGAYYITTEVDGVKYYVTASGSLEERYEGIDASEGLFTINQDEGGALFNVGWHIEGANGHFSNTTLIDYMANLHPGTGVFRLDTGNNRHDWESQVFFMNEEGKIAIRSCNIAYGESSWADAGRSFWTYEVDEAGEVVWGDYGPMPCYSYEPAYIWTLEQPIDFARVYLIFNNLYCKYEDFVWEDVDEPCTLNMGTEFGQLSDWDSWRELWNLMQEVAVICDNFVDPDYDYYMDPDAPTLEQAEEYAAKADSLYQVILDSEVPYTMEDGYYRIYAVKRYKSGTGNNAILVDKAFAASFDKTNHPDKGVYGTVNKILANFVWKLTKSETGDSVMIQNVGMGTYISFSSPSANRVVMTEDVNDASYVQFDYAGNDYVEPDGKSNLRDLFAIRLASSKRASGSYIHQQNHDSVADDNSPWGAYGTDKGADEELTFWNTTRDFDGFAVNKWTSEWFLEPVSEDEVAELVEAFGPIVNHELLVQKNQELRDRVLETLTLAKDVIRTKMITSADQLDNRFGDPSEGQHPEYLIDGDVSTFWHTTWHGLAEGVEPFFYYGEGYEEGLECHYLQISGMENMVGNCELYVRERYSADNDRVKTLVIMGTDNLNNEDDKWEEILRVTLPHTGKGEESIVPFTVAEGYPYIRLFAIDTDCRSYGFRTFWHAAEIQLYTVEDNPNSLFAAKGEVAKTLERIYNENVATSDEYITEEMYQALMQALEAFLDDFVSFADANVKAICVSNWDTNGDGELGYTEATAVTSLGTAFCNNTKIKTFDELQYFTGMTAIADSAFYNCKNLDSITLPENVKSIGLRTFEKCNHLTTIDIPGQVTTIGEYAFRKATGLVSITIPKSVTSIGKKSFADCTGLTDVWCYAQVPNTKSSAFENSSIGTATLHVPGAYLRAYNSAAPWNGFANIVPIEDNFSPSIDFADANVKAVCVANWDTNDDGELSEDEAAAVTSLETAFMDNSQIKTFAELQYFTGLTAIADSAFFNCKNMTSITLPKNVKSIGVRAFYYCSRLTTVAIPSRVTTIGDYAFRNCYKLTSIVIPKKVKKIGSCVFYNCYSLSSLEVQEGNTTYDSRENCNAIIKTSTNTLIAGCMNTSIPEDVTSIGDYAFKKATGLVSINIPQGVTSIGKSSFSECTGLTDVWCYAKNVPNTSSNAFESSSISTATLHVPAPSMKAYKATAPWSNFGSIVAIEGTEPNNMISGVDIVARSGQQVKLPIELTNEESLTVVGISFTLTLPQDVTVATDLDSDPIFSLESARLNPSQFTVYTSQKADDSWNFRISTNNATAMLNGTEGAFMTISLSIASDMAEGSYGISLTDNKLSVKGADNIARTTNLDDTTCVLTIDNSQGSDFIMGDVNSDGEVDLSDAIMVIYRTLDWDVANFNEAAADMNEDGEIDLSDAITIIYKSLGVQLGNNPRRKSKAAADGSNLLQLGGDGNSFAMSLSNEDTYVGFQCDIKLPEGATLSSVNLSESRAAGHTLVYNRLDDGSYRVVAFSMNREAFFGDMGDLLQFTAEGSVQGDVSIENIFFIDTDLNKVAFNDLITIATGIQPSLADTDDAPVYNLAGQQIVNGKLSNSKLSQGLYIQNGRKVVLK